MPGLRKALNNLAEDGDSYVIEAPEGWTQGRTLYGGMTAALCAEALTRQHAELPPLRSAQFAFMGPATGTLRLTPQLLRQGSSSAVAAVDCHAQDSLVARAIFTHGLRRESEVSHDLTPVPEVPGPDDCEPFRMGDAGPGFFQNFEMRLAAGARPFSQDGPPQFMAWVRHLDDEGVHPEVSLLALADSLPPAALVVFPRRGPISTMTWGIDFCEPITGGDWFLLRSASEQAADGYSQQAMDVWSREGVRVATGRQTVALFV